MILTLLMIDCAVVLVGGVGFAGQVDRRRGRRMIDPNAPRAQFTPGQAEAASKRLGHTDGGPYPGGG